MSEIESEIQNEAAETAAVVADVVAEVRAEEIAAETASEITEEAVETVEELAEEIAETVNDFKEEVEWEKTRALIVQTMQEQTAAIIAGVSVALNPIQEASPSSLETATEELMEATELAEATAAVMETAEFDPLAASPDGTDESETSRPTRRRVRGLGKRK